MLSVMKKYDSYVSIDIETTGLGPNAEIIQIGALKHFENSEIERVWYLRNSQPLSYFIQNLTGITDEILSVRGVQRDDAIAELEEFTSDVQSIIGYNIASFDSKFLSRAGFQIDRLPVLDVLYAVRQAPIPTESNKLEVIKDYYGIQNTSHDALDDAKTTSIIYQNLLNGIY
jgi:DNA polymerase III epsilon subunit-like protein